MGSNCSADLFNNRSNLCRRSVWICTETPAIEDEHSFVVIDRQDSTPVNATHQLAPDRVSPNSRQQIPARMGLWANHLPLANRPSHSAEHSLY